MRQFLKTGNFDADVRQKGCLNSTFLTPDGSCNWALTDFLSCPFDAYFPVPFNDQPSSDLDFGNSAYRYCKVKLQSLATGLQNRKDRIAFTFHLNSSIDLCLKDVKLKSCFQVIHCTDIVDDFGLANILIAATGCLADIPESVLLTETRRRAKPKPTVTKYVEDNLCCPVSLITTVYGVRLANHVGLGSTECHELHNMQFDCSKHVQSVITLKWLKAPTYSTNIKLGLTSDLKMVIERLTDLCHLKLDVKKHFADVEDGEELPTARPLTPLTLFYILQSLLNRLHWVDGTIGHLVQMAIPSCFSLAWKTMEKWINGHTVLVMSTMDCAPPGGLKWNGHNCLCHVSISSVQWWLVGKELLIKHKAQKGHPFPPGCLAEAQRIDKILNSNDPLNYMPGSRLDSNYALLLAPDHGFGIKTTQLCITDVDTGELIYFTDFFKWFSRSATIVNSNPRAFQH